MAFQPISLGKINEGKTRNLNPEKKLYDVVFELSHRAPIEWQEMFNARWEREIYSMKRHAHANGNTIVIHCPLDEIQAEHVEPLRRVIDEVNRDYGVIAAREDQEAARLAADEAEAKQKIRDINRGL